MRKMWKTLYEIQATRMHAFMSAKVSSRYARVCILRWVGRFFLPCKMAYKCIPILFFVCTYMLETCMYYCWGGGVAGTCVARMVKLVLILESPLYFKISQLSSDNATSLSCNCHNQLVCFMAQFAIIFHFYRWLWHVQADGQTTLSLFLYNNPFEMLVCKI